MNDEKKETRQEKAAAKARASAKAAVRAAFKSYQRWQVADCIRLDSVIDAGSAESFADFVKDEIK